MGEITVSTIQKSKNKKKLVMITAYDFLMAKIFDSEVDMILVGDSLAMSFGGYKDTLSLNVDTMIYHTQAVRKAITHALLITDMPFGSNNTPKQTLKNAIKIYKESYTDAIKLEGGTEKAQHIELLTQNGIAVMGHIGLKPQYVRYEGGYKIKGKDSKQAQQLLKDTEALNKAGVFCIVLEGVTQDVAQHITQNSDAPIIGIGSGAEVDGQVLVWSDAFGFFEEFKPKFVRHYINGAELLKKAIKKYAEDVRNKTFPSKEESY